MENIDLIQTLKLMKEERGYTLYDLSKKLDIQVSTVSRWFKTNRINRIYAELVKEKLKLF
ncbi:MAG: helix-turn-helix transcriptional regulator [Candidatus Omnitrophica bacterium]|nr:helix-turn-helix transcriptional regulator [Candidatus Omnitrophota bacterium]